MGCIRRRAENEELRGSKTALQNATFPGQGVDQSPKGEGGSAGGKEEIGKSLCLETPGMAGTHEHFPEGTPLAHPLGPRHTHYRILFICFKSFKIY